MQRSFGFKLAHGLILRVFGDTLGKLWRKHEGSDDVQGTYAHWLRFASLYLNIPPTNLRWLGSGVEGDVMVVDIIVAASVCLVCMFLILLVVGRRGILECRPFVGVKSR